MKTIKLPVIALKSMTMLPGMVIHFDINGKKSIKALQRAMKREDQRVIFVSQKNTDVKEPEISDLYNMGTVSVIKEVIVLSDDMMRVQAEGISRTVLIKLNDGKNGFESEFESDSEWLCEKNKIVSKAMASGLHEMITRFYAAVPEFSKSKIDEWLGIEEGDILLKKIISEYNMPMKTRQAFLEEDFAENAYQMMGKMIIEDTDAAEIKEELGTKIRAAVDKNQRDYLLHEQLKVISKELGDQDYTSDTEEFLKKLEKLKAPKEIKSGINKEIQRFKVLAAGTSEANVERGYIETLLDLPWNKESRDNKDIDNAQKILDRDHYGMKKIKERIIETLAVRNVTGNKNAPIICLVGPPGTGKTSIAHSVAEALGRNYVRICLGGVRDEAEIRGHRKTYVGAMPGRIIAGLKTAGTSNPLMLLDEIDKVSNDYRSDTSAALLEVLDPEQNSHFVDHYVEFPVDLSKVLFIATANDLSEVSQPLIDRMEIIEVNSYTLNEKMHIAKEHLIPRQLSKNGLTDRNLKFTDKSLEIMINSYTCEAGVRGLERTISSVCRKAVRKLYENGSINQKAKTITLNARNITEFLGNEKYKKEKIENKNQIGVVRGLAWTSVGGDTLEIEVNTMPGKESVILTGSMGDVMKESARIALSYVMSATSNGKYNIEQQFYEENTIHLHIPEGAVPKDGPSAGITMATAMLSAVCGIPVKADVAMTGELTLTGRVLPIGGLKEKLLAAASAGVHTVLVPEKNKSDVDEFEEEITKGLNIIFVKNMRDVLENALCH